MSATDVVGTLLSGTGLLFLGGLVKHTLDAYKTKRTADVEEAKTDAQRASREADASVKIATLGHQTLEQRIDTIRSFAEQERSDRRRMESEIRELRRELLDASVALAKAQEAADDRDSLFEMVAALRTQVDMQAQLIDRQKRQIDDLVRRLMERHDSVPPGATA